VRSYFAARETLVARMDLAALGRFSTRRERIPDGV